MELPTATSTPIATGILLKKTEDGIVLGLPNTDYQLHLKTSNCHKVEINQTIQGHLFAKAKRIDVVATGGRFIEPVYGRPRRLQGKIIATNPTSNTITVHCGCPFVCALMPTEKASQFRDGMLVGFDIERGATFDQI